MRTEDVVTLSPQERFLYWITERESIRLKKATGQSPPWTDDEILQRYRFTNVRRMDDKVSLWLLHNWYKPNFGHRNMLIACAMARFINRPESLEAVGFPGRWNPEKVKAQLRSLRAAGHQIFNAAYMVRGNDGVDKIESVVTYYIQPLVTDPVVVDPSSMQRTWEALECRYGFGSFMAGQVVADLRWALPGTWEDRDSWAPAGPGSLKGMARLLGAPVNPPTFSRRLRGVIMMCLKLLPAEIATRLEAIDVQNCLCEFMKAEKAWFGEGRPKQLYREGVPTCP